MRKHVISNLIKPNKLKKLILAFVAYWLSTTTTVNAQHGSKSQIVNILFTSDVHYGLSKQNFRGESNVDAQKVNVAMIAAMNTIPTQTLPAGNGVGSQQKVDAIDYLVETGDIANRMDIPIQTASLSWQQFKHDYYGLLKLKDHQGLPSKILLVPGNHDIANAIGFYKPMYPLTDPSSMVNIYNLMMKPKKPVSNNNYNYATQKVNYSLNISNIHFMFITLWPDSAERVWMEKDLQNVRKDMPVIIFTHDPPIADPTHFTNPTPPFGILPNDKFENLLAEHYKENNSVLLKGEGTDIEQRGFVSFLKAHKNIKAYFHGHSNWNEFYNYHGPENDVDLNVFRVDSPMKGRFSLKDETKLSFQLISIEPSTLNLTVRECFWNTDPSKSIPNVVFGDSKTIALK